MNNYVATFFSHFGAISFCDKLKEYGISAKPSPVPRKLSSSCGTCVKFTADAPPDCTNEDMEAIYLLNGEKYEVVAEGLKED